MPRTAPRSAALAAAVQDGDRPDGGTWPSSTRATPASSRTPTRPSTASAWRSSSWPEAKRGFVLVAPALGRGALLCLGGALPPLGQRLRTLAGNGRWLAFCGLCLPDAPSITHRRRPKSITRSRCGRRRRGDHRRGSDCQQHPDRRRRERKVAQTRYDLPAFTALDETDLGEIEVFSPGGQRRHPGRCDRTRCRHADPPRHGLDQRDAGAVAARQHGVACLDSSAGLNGCTTGRRDRCAVGRGRLRGDPSAAATPVKDGAAVADAAPSGETVDPATLTQPEAVATEAFVLGVENGHVVLAVTPDEANRAIPYLVQKDRRLLIFRTLTTAP